MSQLSIDVITYICSFVDAGSDFKSALFVSRAWYLGATKAHPNGPVKFANGLKTLYRMFPRAAWNLGALCINPRMFERTTIDTLNRHKARGYNHPKEMCALTKNTFISTEFIENNPGWNWCTSCLYVYRTALTREQITAIAGAPRAVASKWDGYKCKSFKSQNYLWKAPSSSSALDNVLMFVSFSRLAEWDFIRSTYDQEIWVEFMHNKNITLENVLSEPALDWDWRVLAKTMKITPAALDIPFMVLHSDRVCENPSITVEIIRARPGFPWNWNILQNNVPFTLEDVAMNPDLPWTYGGIDVVQTRQDGTLRPLSGIQEFSLEGPPNHLEAYKLSLRPLNWREVADNVQSFSFDALSHNKYI